MTDINRRIAAAVGLHREGRLEAAEAAYREILKAAPDHPGVLHNLGIVAAQGGKPDEAVELFDRALAADPGYVSAHLNKGGALRERLQFDEALASYDAALGLDPNHGPNSVEAHVGAGAALHGLGRLEDAAARYERALALQPDHYNAHLSRALILNALDRRAEALDHFQATARIRREAGYIGSGEAAPQAATKRKMAHDAAQFRHLAARPDADDPDRFAALAES